MVKKMGANRKTRPRGTEVPPCPGFIVRVAEDDEARDKLK